MSNVGDTKRVSIATIMRSRAFKAGVEDARAGRGFRPEYETGGDYSADEDAVINFQWDYERGRQLVAHVGSVFQIYDERGKPRTEALMACVRLEDTDDFNVQ